MVRQHRGRRRPERTLSPRRRDHPSLLARPDRRRNRYRRRAVRRAYRARAVRETQGKDCVVVAHVGGRYADIKYAHDGVLEPQSRCIPRGEHSNGSCTMLSRRASASASWPIRMGTKAGPAPAIRARRSSAARAGSPAFSPSGLSATRSSSRCAGGGITQRPATARSQAFRRARSGRRGFRARSRFRAIPRRKIAEAHHGRHRPRGRR